MKTKNIFKTLAFAMLMPAMLLIASCSSDIINDEVTVKESYTIPVTINVTRQGDDPATKATFDGSKLNFSEGDKLFVSGSAVAAGSFAGTLTWTSGGTFSGTITTENTYTGTADALFTAGGLSTIATLLPNGYESYGYLSIDVKNGYDDVLKETALNSFATSKKLAVEQLSFEVGAYTSGTGFALSPLNSILNFTVTGFAPSTTVTATLKDNNTLKISGDVTTDAEGKATFAMGVFATRDLNELTLTVAGNPITLVSSSKTLEAGKIYNITRAVTLPGVFTVAAEKTVKFSPGNLRYVSGAWSFFDHQYDYYATYSADAWDKFGWSNSTNNFGMSTSTDNTGYKGDLVDWGTVPGIGTGWRTLTKDEWEYLFNTRTNAAKKYGYATVGALPGIHGIIILPDNFTDPKKNNGYGVFVGSSTTGWSTNYYSAENWALMEAAGAVFLPATGYRQGTSVQGAGESCSYRSSSRANTESVKYVYFTSSSLNANTTNYGYYGQCVRLVKDAN